MRSKSSQLKQDESNYEFDSIDTLVLCVLAGGRMRAALLD